MLDISPSPRQPYEESAGHTRWGAGGAQKAKDLGPARFDSTGVSGGLRALF